MNLRLSSDSKIKKSNRSYHQCLITCLLLIASKGIFAAQTLPTDSTKLKPSIVNQKILCPTIVVNSKALQSNPQTIATTASTECTTSQNGKVIVVFGSGGGTMATPLCTSSTYPYLTQISQTWGFGGFISVSSGGATTSYTCCKSPNVTASLTTSWVSPDPSTGTCPQPSS